MLKPPTGPHQETTTCTWCGRPALGCLCDTCRLGLEKYPDQNPPIVAAYVSAGVGELETYLGHWAEFDRWLAEHQLQRVRFVPPTR